VLSIVLTGTAPTVVLGTVGGFSTILSMIGFAQIRAWNRISPFIAFFALLQVLLWTERLVPWARQRWSWSRPVLAIAAVAACVLTIALGPPVQPVNPSAVAASFASDQTIVTQIEQVLPPGSNIMQLPYLFYPEEGNPPGTIQDYDPLRPFLADPTGNLNWSYGRLTGRPQADWQAKVTPTRTAADLPALIGMGFTRAYSYDADGNRTQSVINGTTVNSTYNTADQATSTGNTYDANGSATAVGSPVITATYNPLGQMDTATRSGSATAHYIYAGGDQVLRAAFAVVWAGVAASAAGLVGVGVGCERFDVECEAPADVRPRVGTSAGGLGRRLACLTCSFSRAARWVEHAGHVTAARPLMPGSARRRLQRPSAPFAPESPAASTSRSWQACSPKLCPRPGTDHHVQRQVLVGQVVAVGTEEVGGADYSAPGRPDGSRTLPADKSSP
jgi:hypothetical protein